VQNCSDHIIFSLSLKLFLWQFVQVVVLVEEKVVQSQSKPGGDDTSNTDGVDGNNRCVESVANESRPEKPKQIVLGITDVVRVS